MKEVQISANVSETTKELFEREIRATGQKKGHLIETALLHHLEAVRMLPQEFITPTRLVVSRQVGEHLLDRMENAEATPALRELMRAD